MKRVIPAVLLALCFAHVVVAQDEKPKKALLHRVFDKKFLAVTAINVGFSVARSVTVNRCRHDHGIGQCNQGGYGEFKAREGLQLGLTTALVITSYYIKKAEDKNDSRFKFWWTLQTANATVNARIIQDNATRHFHPKEE